MPLDPDRCRNWIKAIGQEDLVYLPIEKLHDIKFVCYDHFRQEDFNASKSRLSKHAVPSVNIPLKPLSDRLMANFPMHIAQYPKHEFITEFTENMRNFCQACLYSGDNVKPMTSSEEAAYRRIISKNIERTDDQMYVCMLCRCMLRKVMTFTKQCEAALDTLLSQDPPKSYRLNPMWVFTTTSPQIMYLGPENENVKLAIDYDEIQFDDDIPLVLLGRQDMGTDDSVVDDSYMEDIQSFKRVKRKADTRRKDSKKKKPRRKKKKALPEGFSSRMVQETNEYVVIKLTKEQVLEEMNKNATAEKYLRAPFKCDKCVKGFNFEDVLNTHMLRHSPKNGALQCDICGQYCTNAVSLRGHIKSHNTRYKCKICGIVRLSRQHILEHHGIEHTAVATSYSCKQCPFTTNKRSVIQHHVRRHAATDPHPCHLCGKLFRKLETLRVHMARHDENKRHPCEHCKLTFVYPSQLNKHVRSVHENKDYYCVECDMTFKSKAILKLHFERAKRHRDTSAYKYKCDVCEQRFVSESSLATHRVARHERGERGERVVCVLCPDKRGYTTRAALRVHMMRVHRKGVLSSQSEASNKQKSERGAALARAATVRATNDEHENSEEPSFEEDIKIEQ